MLHPPSLLTSISPTIYTIEPKPGGKAVIRVAGYCRVSTSRASQLESIEAQKNHLAYLCSLHRDWQLADIYYEEGQSATSIRKRPELCRMIRDCSAGRVDLIVTKSISRFARNTTDCLELTRMLTDIGVQVYFEKEGIRTGTMESELMLSIMASLAEDESRSISDNSRWACRSRFRTGTYTFSNVPFGYRRCGRDITIHPPEAEIVRYIFSEAAAGASCRRIAQDLNSRGVPRQKTTGRWHSAYISRILRNPFYKGCVLHQKTYTDRYFRKHINRGEQDRYFITGHHTPIISADVFDAVQRSLDDKNKKSV